MLDEIFNGSESEDNYKRNYTSRFNFQIFKIAFNISYVYVYCLLPMSEYFLARMKRTNRENGEAIGLNEPRPVPARQNRSRDWSNNQGIITLGGTAWIHYRSSSNDNCYITRRFGLWERQKSRGSIPEYKWHFQEHASDRVRIRRLTGSICNILSRNGSERRERR